MTEKQAEIVMAFARSNMHIRETGRAMFMHPTSVLYNLNRVSEKTGKNPRNFFDLCYLVGIAAQMGGSK
jgi:sugar diacid utilization regulator